MSILAKPTIAPPPRTPDVPKIAFFFAGILLVMAVAQLFTFDTFLTLLLSFNLPVSDAMTYFLGALLVVTEVFALPFLLRMPLSRAFRWVSMVCGWLVALIWVTITVWIAITEPAVSSVGFLGTVADIMPGWWNVFISLSFVILAAWAAWGLWPGKRKK